MKLRKALEKAKQARGNPPSDFQSAGGDRNTVIHPDAKGNGGDAPIYSESRHKKPDLRIMEKNRCVGMFPSSPEIDCYKVLRTQIEQRTREKGWNTLMITSPNPGEGKSLTAVNLALTFSKVFDQTVLLVDCDLQYQRIYQHFGFESDCGLYDYLTDNKDLKDIIIWPGIEKMTIVSGGKRIRESTEILNSPKMRSLVAEMKSRYDNRYIIFDVPPLLAVADAVAFASVVDGIVMVIEEGKTSLPDVKKAVELIPRDKLLGYVMNKQGGLMKTAYGK